MILEHTVGFFPFADTGALELPFAGAISAGFPLPASDCLEDVIDLNTELVHNPNSTFVGRVTGFAMKSEGISEDDILVIDSSVPPLDGRLAVCFIDNTFTLRRITHQNKKVYLVSGKEVICINEGKSHYIYGIVTYIIKKVT